MNAHPGLEKGLDWLLNHSLQAGVLVLLVLAVQWIFRRQLASRWRFALWWIVLARLLLPFSPESALSLFNVFRPVVHLAPSVPAVPTQVEPVPPTGFVQPDFSHTENATPPLPASPMASPLPPPPPPSLRDFLVPSLAALWLAGVVVLCGVVARQLIRFHRKLARASVPSNPELQNLLDGCRREFGVSRQIELLETDAVQSPALFGLWRRRLLLPRGIGGQFTGRELRYIFLHEIAHVKRGDLWLNWLVTALQILHWFNPLLWFGFARLRADRELACDELALLRAGDNAGTAYGETVVKLLENLSRPAAIPGLVGILEDKKQMRRRISMIVNFRRPGRWSALAVILIAAIAAAALTDAQTQTNKSANASGRIKVETDATDIPGMASSTDGAGGFDETYTAQNNAPHVHVDLPGARTNGLDLNTEWSKKYNNSSAVVALSDLTGIVHDPANHPIMNATILIIAATPKEDGGVASQSTADCQKHATSDAAGKFAIKGVDTNMLFRVLVMADSYQPELRDGYQPEAWARMDTTKPMEITLRPKAAGTLPGEQVLGRVVDSDGQPIAGALIQGYMLHTAEAWSSYFGGTDGMALTDNSGDFALRGQSNFIACSFFVEARGFAPSGAFDEVSTGSEVHEIRLSKGASLKGRLLKNGKPVANAGIGISSFTGGFNRDFSVATDGDGRFSFEHIPPGRNYHLFGIMRSLKNRGALSVRTVLVGGEGSTQDAGDLNLEPGFTVAGRLLLPDGKPAPENCILTLSRTIMTTPPAGSPTVGVTRDFLGLEDNLDRWVLRGLKAGRFQFSGVSAGPVSLFIMVPPGYHVSSRNVSADIQGEGWRLLGNVISNKTDLIFELEPGPYPTPAKTPPSQEYFKKLSEKPLRGAEGVSRSSAAEPTQSTMEPDLRDPLQSMMSAPAYTLTPPLKPIPGKQINGVVLLPDGRPAADAKVALQVDGYYLQLGKAKFTSPAPTDSRLASTRPDGSFTLPLFENAQSVVALNNEGIGQVSLNKLESSPQIALQKWGRIEGTLRLGHHAGTNEMMGLWPGGQGSFDSRPPLRYEPPLQPPWYVLDAFQTRTDGQGRFVFMFVPPGWQDICREASTDDGWLLSPLSHIEVRPGETTATNAGVSCRTVVGRLKFNGTTPTNLTTSIGFIIQATNLCRFPVFDIAADGTFRAEYILPGTYNFRFVQYRHRLPDQNGYLSIEGITSFSLHEFTVPVAKNPDDDSIVECGTVEME